MTINAQNSFLISLFLHLLFIAVFIATPKSEYKVNQLIDISFLFPNIENEPQTNKKAEDKPVLKSPEYKVEPMKTEMPIQPKTTEPKTLQNTKSSTVETVEMPVEVPSSFTSAGGVKSDPYAEPSASAVSNSAVTSAHTMHVAMQVRTAVDKSAIISSFANKIESLKHYPYIARRRGIEGTVIVFVHLNKTGELMNIALKASSGYEILDMSTLELIKKATPFRHGYHSDLKIEIPVSYRLMR